MNYETASYLCHHGVKGMKWGVRKKDKGLSKQDRKERKKIDRALRRDSKQTVRRTSDPRLKNRMKVNKQFNRARMDDKELGQNWEQAFKAYKSGDQAGYSEKMKAYNKRLSEISSSFDKPYTEALLKDLGFTKVSDVNKKYVEDYYKKNKGRH